MEPNLDRRALITLAGCGLAAATMQSSTAEAQLPLGAFQLPAVQGEWVNLANNGPCGIFQAGSVLMMVNENGDMATARLQGVNLTVLRGWNVFNLVGQIAGNGQAINFNNGSQWRRA